MLLIFRHIWRNTDAAGEDGRFGKAGHMTEEKIARINELYHKSKTEGLSEAEKKEQAVLRAEYIASVRRNLRMQLNQIDIENADGTVENLGEKYGNQGLTS